MSGRVTSAYLSALAHSQVRSYGSAATAQQIIAGAVAALPYERTCECANALKYALVTRPDMVPEQVKKDLAPIIGRYIS